MHVGTVAVVILTALWATGASAQDANDQSTSTETELTPDINVVSFVDEPVNEGKRQSETGKDDCHPVLARFGRCVEEVRFFDSERAFDATFEPGPVQVAQWQNASSLFGTVMEDMAVRWAVADDPIATNITGEGATMLPVTRQSWDAAEREDPKRTFALPNRTSWLSARVWMGDPERTRTRRRGEKSAIYVDEQGVYPHVRFAKAAGLPPSAPMVRLRGRFATRLAYDGRLHPYDIMDADGDTSQPFFEQMYPYARGLKVDGGAGRASSIPLGNHVVPSGLKTRDPSLGAPQQGGVAADGAERASYLDALQQAYVSCRDGMRDADGTVMTLPSPYCLGTVLDQEARHEGAREVANREFERFYELVGTKILRFAREEYTPTHLRILTALMAMDSPPQEGGDEVVATSGLSAASKYQTDDSDATQTVFVRDVDDETFSVSPYALPLDVVTPYFLAVTTFEAADPKSRMQLFDQWGASREARTYEVPREFFLGNLAPVLPLNGDGLDRVLDRLVANYGVLWREDKREDARQYGRCRDLGQRARRSLTPEQRYEVDDKCVRLQSRLEATRLTGLSHEDLDAWRRVHWSPAREGEFWKAVQRAALDVSIHALDASLRERLYTRLLLDHVHYEIRTMFGSVESPIRTPAELEEGTAGGWGTVLAAHGLYPDTLADRPGAVDPTAICSTKLKLDSRDEPVFKAIDVEQIVIAPRGLITASEVLWAARDQLAFVMIDDPRKAGAKATSLFDLPGDQSVYRLSWKVWSGWHLLWAPEVLDVTSDGAQGAEQRIAARTAAFCEDTVLASPEVVPTLVRASMLDRAFLPTDPMRGERYAQDGNEPWCAQPIPVEDLIGEAEEQETRAKGTFAQLVKLPEQVASGSVLPAAQLLKSGAEALFGRGDANKKRTQNDPCADAGDPPSVRDDAAAYIRSLVIPRLRERVGTRPSVVMSIDHSVPTRSQKLWDYRPRTPYFQEQRPVRDKQRGHRVIHSAAWAHHVRPADRDGAAVDMVSPAYLPVEVGGSSEVQIWRRRQPTDWYFGGGIGFGPYRRATFRCQDTFDESVVRTGWLASVQDCTQDQALTNLVALQEVLGFEFQAMMNRWLSADSRFGIEFGPEVRLDLFHQGKPWFYADADPEAFGNPDFAVLGSTVYPWDLRFTGGMLVGVRFAPRMGPRWRLRSDRPPWGTYREGRRSLHRRVQMGARVGMLVGPTYDGVVGTGVFELWAGWSVTGQGRQKTITPYYPAVLIGPYVRGSADFPLQTNKNRFYAFRWAGQVSTGIRIQLRLKEQPAVEAPGVPEAPSNPFAAE